MIAHTAPLLLAALAAAQPQQTTLTPAQAQIYAQVRDSFLYVRATRQYIYEPRVRAILAGLAGADPNLRSAARRRTTDYFPPRQPREMAVYLNQSASVIRHTATGLAAHCWLQLCDAKCNWSGTHVIVSGLPDTYADDAELPQHHPILYAGIFTWNDMTGRHSLQHWMWLEPRRIPPDAFAAWLTATHRADFSIWTWRRRRVRQPRRGRRRSRKKIYTWRLVEKKIRLGG